jgi:outer membrane protein OmpA-like peptidoglycan-associated protein
MVRFVRHTSILATVLALTLCLAATAAQAGPFDKLKKTVKKAAGEADKAKESAGEAKGAATKTGRDGEGESAQATPATGGETKSGSANGSDEKVSSVSTKFDFVPGDSVMFFDDFTQDELGEFPARWRLVQGTYEVAEFEGGRWLRCVSDDSRIRMKVPNLVELPEFWTLEFDIYCEEPMDQAFTVSALNAAESRVWETVYPSGRAFVFRTGDIFSSTPYEGADIGGRHHVMILARGTAVKVYIDRQRVASVPEYYADAQGKPAMIEFRLWATTKPMMTNVRLAEGCRPPKDMLAAGKLVTYGIRFETGSDVVQPESAPVLRQVAAYLESKPDVKLRITGHTDNVGSAEANLDLSKRRAASVAKVLASEFKIAAERLETDGKGDTKPLSSNAKPEGRAMNRRVEFAKVTG